MKDVNSLLEQHGNVFSFYISSRFCFWPREFKLFMKRKKQFSPEVNWIRYFVIFSGIQLDCYGVFVQTILIFSNYIYSFTNQIDRMNNNVVSFQITESFKRYVKWYQRKYKFRSRLASTRCTFHRTSKGKCFNSKKNP